MSINERGDKPVGGLTPKQEAFVLVYLETGNASEAYRQSYECSGMKEASINREAKALTDNPKIAARLQILQARAAAKAVLTRQWIIEQLMDNATKAKAAADFTASNKALELLGKTDEVGAPMFTDKSHVTSDNRNHNVEERLSTSSEWVEGLLGSGEKAAHPGSRPN